MMERSKYTVTFKTKLGKLLSRTVETNSFSPKQAVGRVQLQQANTANAIYEIISVKEEFQ